LTEFDYNDYSTIFPSKGTSMGHQFSHLYPCRLA